MTSINYLGGPTTVYTRAAPAMLPYLDSFVLLKTFHVNMWHDQGNESDVGNIDFEL